ncbi:Ycf49-like protein [Citrus sinensis]|nr:Ycf49-like protein [Citrus sinensis]
MAITTTLLLHPPNPISTHNHKRTLLLSNSTRTRKPIKSALINGRGKAIGGLIGAGLALTLLEPVSAAELPLQLSEPANALSLPTWAIHVSSVAEWITAMALVWQYGEKSGFESWKGLSWGMVLVALQGALTVIGNATMCYAAYRIYKSSEERSQNL